MDLPLDQKLIWLVNCLQRDFNHNFQLLVMEPCNAQTLLKLSTMTKDKEEDGEYKTLYLHETKPIEITNIVMLEFVTKSTHEKSSTFIVLKLLKMK